MFCVFVEVTAAYVCLGVFGVGVCFDVLACVVVVSCVCSQSKFYRWPYMIGLLAIVLLAVFIKPNITLRPHKINIAERA